MAVFLYQNKPRSRPFFNFLFFLRGMIHFFKGPRDLEQKMHIVYETQVEKNHLEYFRKKAAMEDMPFYQLSLRIGGRQIFSLLRFKSDKIFQMGRIIDRVGNKQGILSAYRTGELLLEYLSFKSNYRGLSANFFITSNNGSPLAFSLWAALSPRNTFIFVEHGISPPDHTHKMFFDANILWNGHSIPRYQFRPASRIFFMGIPMERKAGFCPPFPLTVGILSSKLMREEVLLKWLDKMVTNPLVASVLIRPHPNSPPLKKELEQFKKVKIVKSDLPLLHFFDRINFVMAGNTNAHLEALKYGHPSVYVPGLDYCPYDNFEFVAKGLLPEVDPQKKAIDFAEIIQFFQKPDWKTLFKTYDEENLKGFWDWIKWGRGDL